LGQEDKSSIIVEASLFGVTIFVNPHFGQTNLYGFGCTGKIYPL
jgi:hypothetical protein